jgi:hypothetical protein
MEPQTNDKISIAFIRVLFHVNKFGFETLDIKTIFQSLREQT